MNFIRNILFVFALSTLMAGAGQTNPEQGPWRERIERDPFDLVALFNYAQVLEQQDKNAEAMNLISKVEILRPREDFYLPIKAHLLEKMNRDREAFAIWQGLVKDHPEDSNAYKRLYQSGLKNGQWQEAYQAAQMLVVKFSDSPLLWHERMALLAIRHLNEPLKSAEHWWQIWLLNKSDMALFRALSTLKGHGQEKLLQEKITQVREKHQLDRRQTPDGLTLLQAMLERQGEKSNEAIAKLLSIKSKELAMLRDQELALAYWEIEHFDMAGAVLERLFKQDPNTAVACQLGRLYEKVREPKRALKVLSMVDIQLADFSCWDIKARTMALQGDSVRALELYKEWLSQAPDDQRAHWSKAMVHVLRGEWNLAREHWDIAKGSPFYQRRIGLLKNVQRWRHATRDESPLRSPASVIPTDKKGAKP